jgi:hypothetical protein
MVLPNVKYLLPCSQWQPLGPILSHNNPVHIVTNYFFETHLNIIPQYMHWSPSDLFHSDFPTKILHEFLVSVIRSTHSTNLILLVFTTLASSKIQSK